MLNKHLLNERMNEFNMCLNVRLSSPLPGAGSDVNQARFLTSVSPQFNVKDRGVSRQWSH